MSNRALIIASSLHVNALVLVEIGLLLAIAIARTFRNSLLGLFLIRNCLLLIAQNSAIQHAKED